jgi:aryl-alcohol dehydrogenase-like predicted oxidoreductase
MNKKRRLGQTDIRITPIGLGVMQFSGRGIFRFMFPKLPAETMNSIVQAALDGGINWFDTAEVYGKGYSEQALANALKTAGQADGDVIVATKWFPFFRTARNILRTISNRQRNLDGFTIDLYQIHLPYSFSSPEAEMNAMAELVKTGKIRSVGVSNFSAGQMRRAHVALAKHGLPLASNQVHYSLINRGIESNGILDAAKELGITIIAWSPLESGLLTGKFHKDPNTLRKRPVARRLRLRRRLEKSRSLIVDLEEIAAAHGLTPAQVALNWLVNFHGDTVVAIPGASKVYHAQQNAGAMNFSLSEEEMARIDGLSRQR